MRRCFTHQPQKLSALARRTLSFDASGQTALITGANRGIGLELTAQLLRREMKVVACARSESADLSSLHSEFPSSLTIETMDVSSDSDIATVADKYRGQSIDALFLNAGILGELIESEGGPPLRRFGNLTREDLIRVFDVNVCGAAMVAQAFLSNVQQSKGLRSVIVTGSGLGSIQGCGGNNSVSYRISKASVNMVARCLHNGDPTVRVLVMNPGWVNTDMGQEVSSGSTGGKDTAETVSQLLSNVVFNPEVQPSDQGFHSFDASLIPF